MVVSVFFFIISILFIMLAIFSYVYRSKIESDKIKEELRRKEEFEARERMKRNCKYCGNRDILIDSLDICNNCFGIISFDFSQQKRIIDESYEIVIKSKNLDTIISRLNLIYEKYMYILDKYESKGIKLYNTSIQDLIKTHKLFKNERIVKIFSDKCELFSEQKDDIESPTVIKNKINKLLSEIPEIINNLDSSVDNYNQIIEKIEITKTSLKNYLNDIEITSLLKNAEKSEFLNHNKKALDKYLEALYLIKHDNIDDSLQQELITKLENKIELLKKE